MLKRCEESEDRKVLEAASSKSAVITRSGVTREHPKGVLRGEVDPLNCSLIFNGISEYAAGEGQFPVRKTRSLQRRRLVT